MDVNLIKERRTYRKNLITDMWKNKNRNIYLKRISGVKTKTWEDKYMKKKK